MRYIRKHSKVLYTNLLISGKLNSYLADIDRQAEELFFRLVEQMAEREGIIEKLKTEHPLEWVGAMNALREADKFLIFMYFLVPHPVPATWRRQAQTRIRATRWGSHYAIPHQILELSITSSFSCTIFSDMVCCLLSEWRVATSFYRSLANYIFFSTF